jgi:hypothetical protein
VFRRVGKGWRKYRGFLVANRPYRGYTRWTLRMRLAIRGRWMTRSRLADADHALTYSAGKLFTVR